MKVTSASLTISSPTLHTPLALPILPRDLRQFHLDDQHVAGHDRLAPFHVLGGHEIRDLIRRLGLLEHQNARHLRHGFQLQHARHDGMPGKMPLKIRLVDGDVLDADDVVAVNLHHPVHHQERRTVRQHLHDLLDVHGARLRRISGTGADDLRRRRRERLRRAQRLGHLRDNLPDHLAIRRVARLDGDQMPAHRPAQQRQVAHDVEHLVPDKFLGIPQRLGRQHRVVADDHRVFQAAALDEAVFDEMLNLLVKAKRPGVRQFPSPRFWA